MTPPHELSKVIIGDSDNIADKGIPSIQYRAIFLLVCLKFAFKISTYARALTVPAFVVLKSPKSFN